MKRRRNFSRQNFDPGGNRSRVSGTLEEKQRMWWWQSSAPLHMLTFDPPPAVPQDEKADWKEMQLVDCGRLVELHYRMPEQKATIKDKLFKIPRVLSNTVHLAFDPNHPSDRLYIVTNNPKVRKKFKDKFYVNNPHELMPLSEMAEWIGGRHATDDYFDCDAKAVGILTAVTYACEKVGDGYSFYIHRMGEESGIQPILAVSSDGSLWIAGGNYTCPIQGITD